MRIAHDEESCKPLMRLFSCDAVGMRVIPERCRPVGDGKIVVVRLPRPRLVARVSGLPPIAFHSVPVNDGGFLQGVFHAQGEPFAPADHKGGVMHGSVLCLCFVNKRGQPLCPDSCFLHRQHLRDVVHGGMQAAADGLCGV